jgi:pilus assembly protein CpaE
VANANYRTHEFPVAMLLVSMDEATGQKITHAAAQKRWATTFYEQSDYTSDARRPSFRSQTPFSTFCVAFIDFDRSLDSAVTAAQYLQATFTSGITIIAVAHEPDAALIMTAMRSGCTEFMPASAGSEELAALMDRLELLSLHSEHKASSPGIILSLIGVKGGVGTTSVAVNLAATISKSHGKRTLLIDAHKQLGHACVYLGLNGSHGHFGDVVTNVNRLDSELLRGFVLHHASGLDVLESPDKCDDRTPWEHDALMRTLVFLRSEYEYIIVDCPMEPHEVSATFIEASTQVYLVTAPEIGAIRDLSRHVDRFSLIENASDKLKVVLNRSSTEFSVNADQIERAIKLPIAVKLPNKYTEMVRSQNLGEPIALGGDSDLATQVKKWSASIVGVPLVADAPQKKSLLSWFKPAVAAPTPAREM